ncbi:MAG: hypothetical protein N2509_08615, partial [Treponemataceae bacterium]|nr:hypothetical protein [Treponemataceae bacterium]
FREIQETFRANPSLGTFSAFVKQATVEAWWRRHGGKPALRGDSTENLRAEIAELRRELIALRARLTAQGGQGRTSPCPSSGQFDEAQAIEALEALEQLAKAF